MSAILLGVLIGVLVGLAACAPLLASWPTRLRCLLVAQTMDPFGGTPAWSGGVMCEVAVVAVTVLEDTIEVSLAEGHSGSLTRLRQLVMHSTAPGLVAKLEGWCAIRLPLLLSCDQSGHAQLAGPGTTLTGFQEASQLA